MSDILIDEEPKIVWRYFDKIRQIPHGSSNERALGDAILLFAKEQGCIGKRDRVGNVVISVPPSPGSESAPTVVIQSHMDMVCEKDRDCDFDFSKDAIVLKRDGDWVSAHRTTLGADNGIGLAASLSLMEEKDLVHGPLEILVTVEEETGLTGASALSEEVVSGRILLNVDTEDDGVFCVGCAGGLDTLTTLPLERVPVKKNLLAFELEVLGLRGGHSGVDIRRNPANAIVLAARVLKILIEKADAELSWFIGGDKHNAVPREAFASLLVLPSKEAAMFDLVTRMQVEFQEEFKEAEPNLRVTLTPAILPSTVLSATSAQTAIAATLAFPNGVLSLMRDMPEVVETSNNLAKIRCDETSMTFLLSSRSSIRAAKEGVAAKIESVASLAGARFERKGSYPGWKPNMASPLLQRAKAVWKKAHNEEPKVEVIHAGLECGIIGEKLPGIDMISFGPTIQHPHSPLERVSISSVRRFYVFLKALVADIALP
jgi:dipeptidase D